jgi:hypothetical protein
VGQSTKSFRRTVGEAAGGDPTDEEIDAERL